MSVGRIIVRIAVYGLLLAVISNACTTINIINDRLARLHYIDSSIKPYTDKFISESSKRNLKFDLSKLTVILGTTRTKDEPDTIGTCDDVDGFPVIVLDRSSWNVADVSEKEQLVFHELGHCILGRDHCEIKEKSLNVSLMVSNVMETSEYDRNRDALVDELFKPHKGCQAETGHKNEVQTTKSN